MRRATLALLAMLLSTPTYADDENVYVSPITSPNLARVCAATEGKPEPDNSFCAAYALGIVDDMAFEGTACTSAGFTSAQAVAVARKYLRDHPEQWNMHPTFLLRIAFKSAFYCKC